MLNVCSSLIIKFLLFSINLISRFAHWRSCCKKRMSDAFFVCIAVITFTVIVNKDILFIIY